MHTEIDENSPLPLVNFITYRMARVQNKLNGQASRILKRHSDLSLTHWRIISVLSLLGSISAARLSKETGMDKAQVSRAVKALSENGYLHQADHQSDQRQHILSLTQKGADMHQKLMPVMRQRQGMLTEGLAPREIEMFHKVLDQLDHKAGEIIP